jgi:hypothetical protein
VPVLADVEVLQQIYERLDKEVQVILKMVKSVEEGK